MKKVVFLIVLCIGSTLNAQIVNIPDANFKAKLLEASSTSPIAKDINGNPIAIDINDDNEIQTDEALNIYRLNISNIYLADVTGLEAFINLTELRLFNTDLPILDISQLNNLTYLRSYNNPISNLDLSQNINLLELRLESTNLDNLNLSFCTNLTTLWLTDNNFNSIDVSQNLNLEVLNLGANNLDSIDLTQNLNLVDLDISFNNITSIDLSQNGSLIRLVLNQNNLTNLNLTSNLSLRDLSVGSNNLDMLELPQTESLESIQFANNNLNTIDVSPYMNLHRLSAGGNNLTSLDVSQNPILDDLSCWSNQITSIDVSQNTELRILNISDNLLTSLDVSSNSQLVLFECDNNDLLTILAKNGSEEAFQFIGNPNLSFICADENQIDDFVANANSNTLVTSYCSFVPGGNYNTITGNVLFDVNNDGCDTSDYPNSNFYISINDGSILEGSITNASGNYTFYTQDGNFDINPNLENPTWFNFSPLSANTSFSDNNNNLFEQDFCVTANGTHNDLEIVIIPFSNTSPGFDANYQILFRNKGNQLLTGDINFAFDGTILDFVTALPLPDDQTTGSLTWNYTNLVPFETRSVDLTLNLNSPTETPPLNIGDILDYSVEISPITGDETPDDNSFDLQQTVVGSYDPNDITCLEGDIVEPNMIGEYLHYNVRFENTGNAAATFVVVANDIDETQFDLDSFQIMHASHDMMTRITNNKIEFIFDDINLEPEGMGNVVYKIRSLDNLDVGDSVSQQANIFFDYNFPIETNVATTIFHEPLSVDEYSLDTTIQLFPNPVVDVLNVKGKSAITSIRIFDVHGRAMYSEKQQSTDISLDISNYSNGLYFVEVESVDGKLLEKLIKQ